MVTTTDSTLTSKTTSGSELITQEPAITKTIIDQPIVDKVIEKKNVQVQKQEVIREIVVQPIIEVERRIEYKYVPMPPGTEIHRTAPRNPLEFSQLRREVSVEQRPTEATFTMVPQPFMQQQQTSSSSLQSSTITQQQPIQTTTVVQEELARPVQQTIVQEEVIQQQPIVQQQFVQQQQPIFQQQSLMQSQQSTGEVIDSISCVSKTDFWGLSNRGNIFHLVPTRNGITWDLFPTGNLQFRDLSVTKKAIYGIGLQDGMLYWLNTDTSTFDRILSDGMRLRSVSALSRNQIYAVGEDGSLLYLNRRNRSALAWERIGANMRKVCVGSKHLIRHNMVWAIGIDNSVYRYEKTGLIQVPARVLDLSVGVDNSVYAIDLEGRLMKWNSHSSVFDMVENAFRGESNTPRNAFLTGVSVYKNKHVFGIERGTGNVLKVF